MDTRYRFGIEEEYFLADADSRGTPSPDAARAFHTLANEIPSPPASVFFTPRQD